MQDIYNTYRNTLQQHLPVEMDHSRYEVQEIWGVLIAASFERLTIDSVCGLFEKASSPNTARTSLQGILPKNVAELSFHRYH